MIRRALISVSDKTGIQSLAQKLHQAGVEIISTGGTASALSQNGIPVVKISDLTQFPEMMDGRVKTLHPKIHGGLLALRDNATHMEEANRHGIGMIDLLAVNLYPFEATISKPDVPLHEAIENIDIGGPSMIRSASKNYRSVIVLVDPSDYEPVMKEIMTSGDVAQDTRYRLMIKAFEHTARYDALISSYFASKVTASSETLPEKINLTFKQIQPLRYGENPHQKAALYTTEETGGIAQAEQLHGKEMSYNNYVDAEAAWNLVQDFDELAVTIIKHTNPSGVGTGENNLEAYKRALSTDPVSAF
ncbi:MAG TPA: bifunctional phosphoribosylaminoimidazolecarboxamide formyltransferase/IMP cyclohydrolase, partial [bacterium]|nr:bifunctional phosphoribosylaminoimidazolecarboxamide formyltransferase/IMP cyclohydrolase [bacterium]